ncbi:putative acyl-CoA:6-aminopenicillanic-acid-acyltransferase [Aspergillus clavatus NRRL 1]|uniref:Acyl-CoA:6-aminopenicillanic-acid-acyltransferase, putative n=1 Tax=Aspergillus clavatus (strain ATCC 1007 / CBS 513.65 / DSM 816 / NCTC 3887 / NRRL 1 / QM 1276 / 107) TaxID=344612 RepID=A1CL04_ASPCL|nr:acyl-CoA:6-aminopenicillanic-acid-acyltransferase, putative [Aspergillus clavatus NRRL 1]EAW09828.1 acyl-CoA:6-aminopenicillanic-acid-acyltransferase, putative [Aspergillus clavatus NRRL 1]
MQLKIEEPPRLELKGTPREIGLEHGRLLQDQIKDQIKVYENMFQETSKLSWDAVRELAEEFRASLEQKLPEIYEEMQGIADGAGLDLLDIVALNCRSEIAMGFFSDGCTSLSWKKHDNARILSQNWDWAAAAGKNIAIVSIEQPGKPKVYMVTEAGIVGKIGFNSAGVGVCLNAIRARPCISSKVPIHVALRLCAESLSVNHAVEKLSSLGGIACSVHILVADSTTALGLELSPLGDVHLTEDALGTVAHTNHFIENRYVYEPPWLSGSPIRLDRTQQLVRELNESGISGSEITPGLLRDKIFSDTFNAPQAICCSEDPARGPAVRSKTIFNIIMNLEQGNVGAELVVGRPGSGEETAVIQMPWN